MNIYRLTIEPASSFRSPLQSDTIFGHLLWALRYTAGESGNEALVAFLGRYRAGEPPLLVSAGFPEDTLPAPILAEIAPDLETEVANRVVNDLLRKLAGELPYLPLTHWRDLANGLSAGALQRAQQQTRLEIQQSRRADYRRQRKEQPVTRTAIDRITGSAREGRLFVAEETFYRPPARFDIWHKLADESLLPDLTRWWRWIERNGFGRRKSAGAGAFRIIRLLEPANGVLPQAAAPNGFVSLSAWAPGRNDPTAVTYRTRVKRGKLAEQYALPSPWKKPLLLLEPGAVARLGAGETVREWYGHLVEDMHWTQPGIVHYGLAFPLPVHLISEEQL